MSLTIFPVASSSGSSINAYSYTVPNEKTAYKVTQNFSSAVYTITTSPTSSQVNVAFFDSSGLVYSADTVNGTVTFQLGSPCTGAYITSNTGSNVVATITLVASALTGTTISGTLDTITTTSTYNQTGTFYVLAFGGGGAGGGGEYRGYSGGGGGGSVGVAKFVKTNSPTSVVIGAGGIPGNTYDPYTLNGSNPGGTTTFGSFVTANGGEAGRRGGFDTGAGGSSGGGAGAPNNGIGTSGSAVPVAATTITNGTNGGGGGGSWGGTTRALGGGSGVGTGGSGGYGNTAPNAGTGYGAGGGGGGGPSSIGIAGAAGSQGVVYVLRGIS